MTHILSLVLAVAPMLQAPQAQPAPSPKASDTKSPPVVQSPGSLVLTTKGGILGMAQINARQIEAKVILDRLKVDLKIPLLASNLVAQHKVDLTMKETTVIALLVALAPVVLADIEVGAAPEDAVWKAVHLSGYNEKEPERELKQVGFLVAAGTINNDGTISPPDPAAEDKLAAKKLEAEPQNDKPMLAVVVADGRVSLKARKQPLVALLNEVATRAKVPFDIRGQLDMSPIDIELKDLPLQDLPVALGRPGVRLIVRRNLATGEEWVQGVVAVDARPLSLKP